MIAALSKQNMFLSRVTTENYFRSMKMAVFILIAVKTSNPTYFRSTSKSCLIAVALVK
jgi:hypothetical protein